MLYHRPLAHKWQSGKRPSPLVAHIHIVVHRLGCLGRIHAPGRVYGALLAPLGAVS